MKKHPMMNWRCLLSGETISINRVPMLRAIELRSFVSTRRRRNSFLRWDKEGYSFYRNVKGLIGTPIYVGLKHVYGMRVVNDFWDPVKSLYEDHNDESVTTRIVISTAHWLHYWWKIWPIKLCSKVGLTPKCEPEWNLSSVDIEIQDDFISQPVGIWIKGVEASPEAVIRT